MTSLRNLSIILPARNEAVNLKRIIPAILEKYKNYVLEVIVVDDCSVDNTKEIVYQLLEKHAKIKFISRTNLPGVGLALKEGIKHLSKECHYVLFMDSDFLANVPDIAKLIENIHTSDGIVGSRFLEKNSLENYPKLKFIANRLYRLLTKLFLGIKHSDLTNNFKLYRYALVQEIYPFLISCDFAINAELGLYPVLLGKKIGQTAVHWKERTKHMGLSKFKIIKVGPSYAYILLRCFYLKYFSKYEGHIIVKN